jgi:phosphoglycolate phosphatase
VCVSLTARPFLGKLAYGLLTLTTDYEKDTVMTWKIDAIVWDFDGVVVDTSRDIANAGNFALRQLGLPELPVDTLASYIGGGAEPLVRKMLGERADELFDRALPLLLNRYKEYPFQETTLYPGILEVLEHYARAGKRMGIATNKIQPVTLTILKGLHIEQYFDALIGPEDVQHRKPDPEAVNRVLQALGTRADLAVMIGDTAADIGAGKAAGTLTAGVTYGYGTPVEVSGAEPDVLVDSAADLLKHFI